MPKVLIISLVYPPDVVSTAPLIGQIAASLCSRGHHVTVLTSTPHYHPPERLCRDDLGTRRLGGLFYEQDEQGVRVLRVGMPHRSRRVYRRILEFAWFQLLVQHMGIFHAERPDVIFVTSPPITLGLSGHLISRIRGGRLIYEVRELWPDAPVRMGVIKSPPLIRLTYAIERFVYNKADIISVLARPFEQSIVSRGTDGSKIVYAPMFIDGDAVVPTSKDNPFSRTYGLQDKFVALYAGNIGLTQCLEDLVAVAEQMRPDPTVRIVIVGDGAARNKLVRMVRESGLDNILVLPYLPQERIGEVYGAADVCFVPLAPGFGMDTAPSKVYYAMATGRPIIASVEAATDTADVVKMAEGGFVVPPRSVSGMVEALRTLYTDPCLRQQMGGNARRFILDNFSRDKIMGVYDQMIWRLCPGPGPRGTAVSNGNA